jgi:excisionase family DNA binding protein
MDRLLNIQAAAEMLSLSPWTVRAYIRSGKIRAVRIGRRVLLESEELRRLVNEGRDDISHRDSGGVR